VRRHSWPRDGPQHSGQSTCTIIRRDYDRRGLGAITIVLNLEDARLLWFDFAAIARSPSTRKAWPLSDVPGLWIDTWALLAMMPIILNSDRTASSRVPSRDKAAFVKSLEPLMNFGAEERVNAPYGVLMNEQANFRLASPASVMNLCPSVAVGGGCARKTCSFPQSPAPQQVLLVFHLRPQPPSPLFSRLQFLSAMAKGAGIKNSHETVGRPRLAASRVIQHWNVPGLENKAKQSLSHRPGRCADPLAPLPAREGIENFSRLPWKTIPSAASLFHELWRCLMR